MSCKIFPKGQTLADILARNLTGRATDKTRTSTQTKKKAQTQKEKVRAIKAIKAQKKANFENRQKGNKTTSQQIKTVSKKEIARAEALKNYTERNAEKARAENSTAKRIAELKQRWNERIAKAEKEIQNIHKKYYGEKAKYLKILSIVLPSTTSTKPDKRTKTGLRTITTIGRSQELQQDGLRILAMADKTQARNYPADFIKQMIKAEVVEFEKQITHAKNQLEKIEAL